MKGLNTFSLKCIAIASMLIDHMGAVLFPYSTWMRIVGRLAFPIFAYLLVEGFVYTRDVKKYLIRLGIFALISEIPFDLAFFGNVVAMKHQNVFFELFLGILVLYLMLKTTDQAQRVMIVIPALLISDWLCLDYGSWGLLMILAYYVCREKKLLKLALIVAINLLMGNSQVYAGLAVLIIALHNHELGPKMKLFFYAFYPAHLLILFFISILI